MRVKEQEMRDKRLRGERGENEGKRIKRIKEKENDIEREGKGHQQ